MMMRERNPVVVAIKIILNYFYDQNKTNPQTPLLCDTSTDQVTQRELRNS